MLAGTFIKLRLKILTVSGQNWFVKLILILLVIGIFTTSVTLSCLIISSFFLKINKTLVYK